MLCDLARQAYAPSSRTSRDTLPVSMLKCHHTTLRPAVTDFSLNKLPVPKYSGTEQSQRPARREGRTVGQINETRPTCQDA